MDKARLVTISFCMLVGVAIFVSSSMGQEEVQEQQDWSKLKVVTYASGLTGFFDPDTGKLYIYDGNMENCFAIRQLSQLGEPLKRIKN